MACQRQISDERRVERADAMRPRVEVEAGEYLLGYRGPAHELSAFDHQDLEAGPGHVSCRNQPVVARSDHDGVVGTRHHA